MNFLSIAVHDVCKVQHVWRLVTYYNITVKLYGHELASVWRRYSEFDQLRVRLKQESPLQPHLTFPPKHTWFVVNDAIVTHRVVRLDGWIKTLMQSIPFWQPFLRFLCLSSYTLNKCNANMLIWPCSDGKVQPLRRKAMRMFARIFTQRQLRLRSCPDHVDFERALAHIEFISAKESLATPVLIAASIHCAKLSDYTLDTCITYIRCESLVAIILTLSAKMWDSDIPFNLGDVCGNQSIAVERFVFQQSNYNLFIHATQYTEYAMYLIGDAIEGQPVRRRHSIP